MENAPNLSTEDVVETRTILGLNQNAEKPATKVNRMTKNQVSAFLNREIQTTMLIMSKSSLMHTNISQTHGIDNNGNIGIKGFTTRKQKIQQ